MLEKEEITANGKLWQSFCENWLLKKYAGTQNDIHRVPDRHGGDLGLEAYLNDGTVFQCYAAEDWLSVKDLYEKQRDKITADVGKLLKKEKQSDLLELFPPGSVIKEWILIVPVNHSRYLLQHANTKASELRQMADRPSFIAPDIKISIWDLRKFVAVTQANVEESPYPATAADPWTSAAWHSKLLELSSEDLRRSIADIISHCWSFYSSPLAAADDESLHSSTNPWRDEEWPLRYIECCSLLNEHIAAPPLSDSEKSLILIAGILRFTAIALAEQDSLLTIRPRELNPDENVVTQARLRTLYEQYLAKRPQLERKARRLLELDTNDGDSVIWWMMHHALARQPEVLRAKSSDGALPDSFVNTFDAKWENAGLSQISNRPIAYKCASSIGSDIASLCRSTSLDRKIPAITRGKMVLDGDIRLLLCACVSALSAMMALDPQVLSEVIVDHIGLSEPTTAATVIDHVRRAKWRPTTDGTNSAFSLFLECDHPAIDLALADEVQNIIEQRQALIEAMNENPTGLESAEKIPAFKSSGLIPNCDSSGRPLYSKPHVRFSLAQDEIRELLMGERLYGERQLAIRELYQNALDACRYKRARLHAQYKSNGLDPSTIPWRPLIRFNQGKNERGDYIECIDNGIGMTHDDLLGCFAKAGKRFADTDEYIEESAEWKRHGIAHYPNSQFGIGVFSYFMLAEELEVITTRFHRSGQIGTTLQVNVSGSGSLFRIKGGLQQLPESGTIVRLYLNRATSNSRRSDRDLSVSAVLRDQLYISEVDVEVTENGNVSTWSPYSLRTGNRIASISATSSPNVFWVEDQRYSDENGRLLSDGIKTETKIKNLLVNLTGPYRAKLTADRKTVLSWPRDWLDQYLLQEGWKGLAIQPFKHIHSFWSASAQYPASLQNLFINAPTTETSLDGREFSISAKVKLGEFGLFLYDEPILWLIAQQAYMEPFRVSRGWLRILSQWPRKLLISRIKTFAACGLQLPDYMESFLSRQDAQIPTFAPSPVHSATDTHIGSRYRGNSPDFDCPSDEMSPQALAYLSYNLGIRPSEVLELWRPMFDLGIRPPTTSEAIKSIPVINQTHLELTENFRFPKISSYQIAQHFSRKKASKGEVSAALEQLEAMGFVVEKINSAILDLSPPVTGFELGLIRSKMSADDTQISAREVGIELSRFEISSEDARSAIERLKSIGIQIDDVGEAVAWTYDKFDRHLLSRLPRNSDKSISRLEIIEAQLSGLSVEEIQRRLDFYSKIGIYAECPANKAMAEIDGIDISILRGAFREGFGTVSLPLSTPLLWIAVMRQTNITHEELDQRLDRLRTMGQPVPKFYLKDVSPEALKIILELGLQMYRRPRISPAAIGEMIMRNKVELGCLKEALDWLSASGIQCPDVRFDQLEQDTRFDEIDSQVFSAFDALGNDDNCLPTEAIEVVRSNFPNIDITSRANRYHMVGFQIPIPSMKHG